MKLKNREQLQSKFNDRVSFDKTERVLYSHDTASVPSIIKKMLKTVPEAVVQPLTSEDVQYLIKFANEQNISLTPRGAATSGWGGALPSRGGIVVDFSRMRRIISIDVQNNTATVEAGVIWKNLEYELNKSGKSCRILPSSALSATIAGWVAEGGGGIGSYEYGPIDKSIESVKLVTANGDIKVMKDKDLELVTEAEGITGFITEVVVKTRSAEPEKCIAASFSDMTSLFNVLHDVINKSLNIWHISFSNAAFDEKQAIAIIEAQKAKPRWSDDEVPTKSDYKNIDKKCRALFVYPESRDKAINGTLLDIIESHNGRIMSQDETQKLWNDRFFPIRLKRLGPSLISSESIVSIPATNIDKVITNIENKFPDIAITVTMISHQKASLLCHLLADERSPDYTFQFPRSLDIIDIACKQGGCPYSTGLYFTDMASDNLGTEKTELLRKYKASVDPKGILNPGKILPQNKNPKLLKLTLKLAKFFKPFIGIGRVLFSHKPKLLKRIPSPIVYEAYTCAQCGYCIDVCDQYYGRQWESETSRGRWYFLREYLNGNLEFNQKMLDSFLLCTTCQRCNQVCQVQIPIQQMWDRMRGVVIHEKDYHTFPGFEMMASSFIRESNIWAGAQNNRDKWLPSDIKLTENSKTAYWAGCTASFVEHDIAQNAVHILKEGNVEFTCLGKDEACCGIPFFSAGKWDLFKKAVTHNINELNKRGIEKIVVSCPGCWVTLNHYYRIWAKNLGLKYNVQIQYITEIAADLLKEGKLKFTQVPKDNGIVTYHDPCHIGRHGGIYDPPREILQAIPGIQLVEMEHNRENALCCGSVLSRVGRPPAADAIGSFRMLEAEKTGANIVLTSCPCCEVQLRVGARYKKSPVRVLDLTDIVAEALGYEVTDPTHTVLDAWDVFGTAIDMMTVDGMYDMMTKMMPEIMNAMPGYMKGMMNLMKSMPSFLRHSMLGMMKNMIPMLMPALLPGMLPALMPKSVQLMKAAIPNMPPTMQEMLPDMLLEVMKAIMPPMLPRVAPLIAPKMTEFLEQEALAQRRK